MNNRSQVFEVDYTCLEWHAKEKSAKDYYTVNSLKAQA
jgi:hypothetical protein